MQTSYPLRPFMPADTMALRDLFAQSIEELTAEDYNEDQRLAWVTAAEDAEAFAERLQAGGDDHRAGGGRVSGVCIP